VSTGEEVYWEVIPGSFIIRSGCTNIEKKGEQTKVQCKERMHNVIALIQRVPGHNYTEAQLK